MVVSRQKNHVAASKFVLNDTFWITPKTMEQHAYAFRGTLREFCMLVLLHRIPKPYNLDMDAYCSLGIIRFAFDRAATRDYFHFAKRCVINNGSVAKIRYFYSRHAAPSWSQEFPLPLRFAVLMHTTTHILTNYV